MKVIVIGSGLLGVSTAWALRERGADVTVLDRSDGPARETSFANGALLTPSMADPWNSPGVFWKLMRWLGRENSPMLLRLRSVPSLVGWGLRFIQNSSPRHYRDNTLHNARLALYSLRALEELRSVTPIEYEGAAVGTLRLFRRESELEAAREMVDWLAQHGVRSRKLGREATIATEPALAPIAQELVGAIHYPDDQHGDAFRFCEGLARAARERGVSFVYGVNVTQLRRQGRRVTGVGSSSQNWEADAVVVAAGSYSPQLVESLGIQIGRAH